MTILYVVHTLSGNDGWSRYARDVSREMSKRGHDVHALVAKSCEASWAREHVLLRNPIASMSLLATLAQWWNVQKAIRRIKPEVIHIICEPYTLLLSLIQVGKAKRILTLHGSYAVIPFFRQSLASFFARRGLLQCKAIIAVSAFTKKRVQEAHPHFFERHDLELRISVISNAIDTSVQTRVSSHKSGKRMLSVGALKDRKGILEALQAFAVYRESHPEEDVRYDIVGSTDDKAYVQKVREEMGKRKLNDRVLVHGQVSEEKLQELYQEADLFMLLSKDDGVYFEGFVLAFLEANLRGIPVIGPTTGGCPEAIKNGVSGFLHRPDDALGIAKSIEKILAGALKSEDCISWAKAHDMERAAEKMEVLYNS